MASKKEPVVETKVSEKPSVKAKTEVAEKTEGQIHEEAVAFDIAACQKASK